MSKPQKKLFSQPDDRRTFDKGQVEIVTVGNVTFGRGTFQPGWKWSTCVQPIAKTKSCEVTHASYVVSGRMHIVLDDGTVQDLEPGDVALTPPGHDAWVVGNEPVVMIDIAGMGEYAKPK